MTRKRIGTTGLLIGLGCALLLALGVVGAGAQGQGYSLSWWTADNGGVTALTGGDYVLAATAGQPEAAALEDGDYELIGGFWSAGPEPTWEHDLYLPLVLQNP